MITTRFIRFCLGVIIPLALIPVALIEGKEAKCAYVVILMAAYWITEPVPIPVTALFPVIFFPLFGILSTAQACAPYMSSTNMIFVAGLIMAVAIEHCNLHKRIALKVLLTVGTSTTRLLIGFMLSTAFLSMWISNTATAAMMVPILEAVIFEIDKVHKQDKENVESLEMQGIKNSISSIVSNKDAENHDDNAIENGSCTNVRLTTSNNAMSESMRVLRKGLFLSIAYSANIGGTGTLIGTGPNLVIQGVLNKKYPQSNEITFATWMMYAIPGMLVCLVAAWVVIYFLFLRKGAKTETKESSDSVRYVLADKYTELGPVKFQECAVIFLFTLLILLLFLQDPKFIQGWAPLVANVQIKDATPALATVIFLFLIPANPMKLSTSPPLLDWKTVQNKVPWGIIILLGGGFSMAQGFEQSGLSEWVKNQLTGLNFLSVDALLVVLSVVTAALTEITSNVATATAFLPVVADLAVALYVHPLFLMLPVAIACSFAFMLPIATPPNAIVYDAAGMSTKDMALPGLLMNVLCCAVSVASVNSIGVLLFQLRDFPPWLQDLAQNATTIGNTYPTVLTTLTP